MQMCKIKIDQKEVFNASHFLLLNCQQPSWPIVPKVCISLCSTSASSHQHLHHGFRAKSQNLCGKLLLKGKAFPVSDPVSFTEVPWAPGTGAVFVCAQLLFCKLNLGSVCGLSLEQKCFSQPCVSCRLGQAGIQEHLGLVLLPSPVVWSS